MAIRSELIHPLLSHFPIALLSLLPFLYTASLFVKNKILRQNLEWSSALFLYIGSIFYIMSLFTGDESLDIIKKSFCNLSAVYQHEEQAHQTFIALILALIQDVLIRLPIEKFKWVRDKIFPRTLSINYFIMLILLVLTSHKGALLVYEQGAAVNMDIQRECLK